MKRLIFMAIAVVLLSCDNNEPDNKTLKQKPWPVAGRCYSYQSSDIDKYDAIPHEQIHNFSYESFSWEFRDTKVDLLYRSFKVLKFENDVPIYEYDNRIDDRYDYEQIDEDVYVHFPDSIAHITSLWKDSILFRGHYHKYSPIDGEEIIPVEQHL